MKLRNRLFSANLCAKRTLREGNKETTMKGSLIIFLIAILINTPAFGSNRVLSLDGDGDYVEMADSEVLNDIRAAMNAVLTDGMMHEVAIIEPSCGSILSRLNSHLYPLMEKQMFIAFSFAIIDQDVDVIQWSNAAQPHPLIKRSSGASEADEDGQLPLGMAPDVRYPDCELKLQAGDMVIFYTDGIIEAENEAEEMYGTERLLNLVAGIDTTASAEAVDSWR